MEQTTQMGKILQNMRRGNILISIEDSVKLLNNTSERDAAQAQLKQTVNEEYR